MRIERTLCLAVSLMVLWSVNASASLTPASTGKWKSPMLKKNLETALFVPAEDAPQKGRRGVRPGIIYLKNLAFERVGTEPDESIIADLLKEGYLVVTIDYGKNPHAVAPDIMFDLRVLRAQIGANRKEKWPGLFAPANVDGEHTYILAEGYRIKRNILYCEPEDDGWHLDIRYPSKPKAPVPAIIQNPVENANRAGNWVQYTYNEVLVDAAMTRGYAAVVADNPVKHYKGLDPMPDVAIKLKAAVRAVRASAKECNLSGKVALMGFSRGSGQAGLAGLSCEIKAQDVGLNLDQSSRPDALLLHAGRMDHLFLLTDEPRVGKNYPQYFGDPVKNKAKWDEHSAITYVDKNDPPTFLSVGADDWYRVAQIKRMDEAMTKAGLEHTLAITPKMGHQVTGDVKILSRIFEFFDKHLKGIEPPANTDAPAATPSPTVLKRMQPFAFKKFLIGTWPFGSRYTDAFCKEVMSAGFNVVVDAPNMLDVADKNHLGVIITTILNPVMDDQSGKWTGNWKMGPYARVDGLKWFDQQFGDKPALVGYLLNDNCALHDYTVETARWLRKKRPGQIPFMSHNPDAAGQAKVVDALPILSSQNYPYGYHNDWPEPQKRKAYCDRLEDDRTHANDAGMVLWPIFAVYGKPDLGASQIRFQAFTAIAYGAQGMFYFAWSAKRPVWREGGTVKTTVTDCNAYIVPQVGPRVIGTRCVGVYHGDLDKDTPTGAVECKEDRVIEAIDAGLLAGVLVPESGLDAGAHLPALVMVVDKRTAPAGQDDPPAREASVTFGPSVEKIEILGDAHRTGKIAANTVHLKLRGGDGLLLKISGVESK